MNATGEALNLVNHFDDEQVLFGDGTLWNRTQIFDAASIRGTSGADTFSGGSDAETFDGAGGNDTLNGGGGSDTYIFSAGSGNDIINESPWDNGTDAAKLLGLNSSDVTFTRCGKDLLFGINSSGETLKVTNSSMAAA
jgi:Ca2+-binding RTX toxin-like protein